MPVAKLLGSSTQDAMKSEEGTDSLDTFIRQAVGKEPLFSFSRTGDSPVQWIQLLHALDQQDLPGWPLLSPMKVQMQKCDKCAREFCSPINYRRHIRVHRRSMNFTKEPQKYRELLGAFWDKLSYDEAKEIMSFKDVNLEEVPGSSIVRNIAANLRKPIFLALPQVYVKAGSALVDIVQGRPSRLPISSQELFSILDDASERSFLCAGTAESLQKYVFDGEAGKIGLEMKNLIACTSFLAEQQLVKAWLADKDAEALRCQKLLVEEEEAAQRRQAELLERKKQRKLRQKEQRAKDLHSNGVKLDLYPTSDIFVSTPSTETSTTFDIVAPLEPIQLSNSKEIINIGFTSDNSDSAPGQSTEQKTHGNGSHHFIARWQVPKTQRGGRNGLYNNNQNVNIIKLEHAHKHRDQRVNSSKVWTKKPKSENGGPELEKSRIYNDANNQTTQSNCELMIGSISVTLRNSLGQENGDKENKKNSVQNGTNRSTVKFWRPRYDIGGQLAEKDNINGNGNKGTDDNNAQVEDGAKPEGMPFSIDAAKAFLAQRWKAATSGDHVKLVLSSAPEPPGQLHVQASDSSTHANVKAKFRTKPEKNVKARYVPKQRAVY